MQKKGKKRLTKKQKERRRIGGIILFGVVIAAAVCVILSGTGRKAPVFPEKETSSEAQEPYTRRLNGASHLVCLDAGHGGKDPGASGGGYTESEDVLAMTQKVRDYLEEAGCEVLMTRENDTFLTLEERVQLANDAGAEVLVSIHRNVAADPTACGAEFWINSAEPANATVLGTHILERIHETGTLDTSRGIRAGTAANSAANYWINRASVMASGILELGFLSSNADNAYFHEKMDPIARAIADGILDTLEDPAFTE